MKPLPVLHAARELQFDKDHSEERPMKHLTKISQARADSVKQVNKSEQPELKPEEKPDVKAVTQGQGQGSKTPSRSSSVTFLEDSIKLTSKEADKFKEEVSAGSTKSDDLDKSRTMSDASSASQVDTVSIDNISEVIEGLESHCGKDAVNTCTIYEICNSYINFTRVFLNFGIYN